MVTVAKQPPATWREADGDPIVYSDALSSWTSAARQVLMKTAKTYNAYLTEAELGESIQQISGVRTKSPTRNWIGPVLESVADECHRLGEPALTSLCVRRDESIGTGYGYVLTLNGLSKGADLDHQAAKDRLACYIRFADNLPAHGGYTTLPPKIAAARRREARLNPAPGRLCPSCNTVLPSSGQCDNCGGGA
jgi:hypothetical protein